MRFATITRYSDRGLIKLIPTLLFQLGILAQVLYCQGLPDKTEQLKNYYLTNLDDSSLNYHDVTSFLDEYYLTHHNGKGSGYKQFERWKIRNKHFYDQTGKRIITRIKNDKKSSNIQSIDLFNWTDLGLDSIYNQAGLIEDLAYGNNNRLYAVAQGGGIWISDDSGVNWESLELINSSDQKRFVLDYSCLDLFTSSSGEDIIYASGQNVPLIKSIDSGDSWQVVYANTNHTIREIRISPLNTNLVVAATSNGILKSSDGGLTWTTFAVGNSLEDIAFKPTDDNVIYATGYQKYIRTVDGGSSFEDKSNLLHFTSNRCRIETTMADPNVVYILTASGSQFGELLRSDDSGASFSVQSHSYNNGDNNSNNFFNAFGCWDLGGGIAWHAMDLEVSPTDASKVYIGSNTVATSEDSGQSFRYVGYHHWDVHHISISPNGDIYNGNDGGLFRIIDPNLIPTQCDGNGPPNWEYISDDLQIRLVYNTQKSGENYLVHCQDNNAARYSKNSAGQFHWQALYGPVEGYGIDFDVASSSILYASTYNGNISIYNNPPADPEYFWPNFDFIRPAGENNAFLHPLASDAMDPKVVYGGYRELYKWDWSAGNSNVTAQKISDIGSSTVISEITTFVQNSKHSIFILKAGNLYKTDDSNASPPVWQQTATSVKKFASSKYDRNLLAYINTSNQIFVSFDQGANFINVTGNLNGSTFNTIELSFFNGVHNLLLGELRGNIYYRPTLDPAENWYIVNDYTAGSGDSFFPLTNIQSIKAYDDEIVVGTYGRGAWRGDFISCPTVGAICDDGDLCTINDSYDIECLCIGQFQDSDNDGVCDNDDQCAGLDDILIGQVCDDGDLCTDNDVYDNACQCIGVFQDSDGDSVCDNDDQCPGLNDALINTVCDDGDGCTINDKYDNNCQCIGQFQDSDNDGVCDEDDMCFGLNDMLIGQACDDGDLCTIDDEYDNSCQCIGSFQDSDNDGVCDNNDQCAGLDDALIDTACDDGDVCTINDVYDNACQCIGVFQDSDGDGVCDANENGCTTIYSDDFEIDQGSWTDDDHLDALYVMSPYSPNGDYSMYIRDNSGLNSSITSSLVDLTNIIDFSIQFSYQAVNLEADKSFFLKLSSDGGNSFVIIKEWISGIDFMNNVIYTETVNFSNTFGNSNILFRFECNGTINDDYVYLDDINIETCESDCESIIIQNQNLDILISEQADLSIQTNGIIRSGNTIEYSAGQSIGLEIGFEVELGALFHAFIESCQ